MTTVISILFVVAIIFYFRKSCEAIADLINEVRKP